MLQLNEDILRQIVLYIPSQELDRINSANSIFFEAWMKQRYAKLSFRERDKVMKKLLLHLSDANVAAFVKEVDVQPWLVQPRDKSPRSLTENVLVRVSKFVDPDYTRKAVHQRLQKRLRKDIERVSSAFRAMTNVKTYTIDWDEESGYHPELYFAFLTPVLEMWSAQLLTLSIKVPLSMLPSLARVRMDKLEALTYTFSTGILSTDDIDHAHDGIVVFINNLKDTLSSLTLITTPTSENLDLSRIFGRLGTFPQLSAISVSIPFDGGHLPDPAPFVRFVNRHRHTIREFSLSSNGITRHNGSHRDCTEWVQTIMSTLDKPFPVLRSFGVALRPMRAPLDNIVEFLDVHSATLDSVSLTDRVLSPKELAQLFKTHEERRVLSTSLTRLQFKVDRLTPDIFGALPDLFPNLENLQIECSGVEGNAATRGYKPQFSAHLEQYEDRLKAWSLKNLTLGLPKFTWMSLFEQDLVKFFPNITLNPVM